MNDPLFSPTVRPWARFGAFIFDVTVFFFPVVMLWLYFEPDLYLMAFSYAGLPLALARTFTAIPLIALCTSLTGTTPGKALLGMRVVTFDGGKMSFTQAFQRSIYSFWLGAIGLLEPMGYIMMFFSYRRLAATRSTAWDAKFQTAVMHTPYVPWKIAIFFVILVGCNIAQNVMLMLVKPEYMENLIALIQTAMYPPPA